MTRLWRRKGALICAGLAVLCMGGSMAAAQCASADDQEFEASRGRAIAETWCAACHQVPGGPAPTMSVQAPSFAEILRDPSKDAGYLYDAVTGDHDIMTTTGLRPDELQDVVLYLLELRDKLAAE